MKVRQQRIPTAGLVYAIHLNFILTRADSINLQARIFAVVAIFFVRSGLSFVPLGRALHVNVRGLPAGERHGYFDSRGATFDGRPTPALNSTSKHVSRTHSRHIAVLTRSLRADVPKSQGSAEQVLRTWAGYMKASLLDRRHIDEAVATFAYDGKVRSSLYWTL